MRIRNYLVVVTMVGLVLLAGCRHSTEKSADFKEPQSRHIALRGQSNFRDIGGYKTIDGHTVKWGQVYRSGELPRLTDEDVAILQKLDLRMVHNFLLEEEVAQRGEDRLPEGATLVNNPIRTSADDLVLALLRMALEAGYYDQPKRVTIKVLAKRAGVAPSTFQEILQRAERKVMLSSLKA